MQTKILYNKQILPLYYKLGINWQPLPNIQPGQFIMLRINNRIDPLLRRPFGVYNIIMARGKKEAGVEIVYKIVGKGTKLMTGLKSGDTVDILGPLGNGFPLIGRVGSAHRIIMVAGGIGIAPFYMLGARDKGQGARVKLLFGGRGKDDLPGLEDFRKLNIDMAVSTQDGSVGKKGLVTELLKKELSRKDDCIVYACGPKGMLKAVAKMAEDADVPCYVSLDNAMACGMGACLGCAVKVQGQGARGKGQENLKSKIQNPKSEIYKMVCKDGPVFDAREIAWEAI